MARGKDADVSKRYERALKQAGNETYVLRLYVTGASPISRRAIANIKRVCEARLKGRYRLEVVDIFQQPGLARGEQIVAAPTLIKELPPPLRRFISDMSRVEGLLVGVDVHPETEELA